MGRKRKPYSLFQMKNRVWYYSTYDKEGKITNNRSTGCHDKRDAERFLRKLKEDTGSYVLQAVRKSQTLKFKHFATDFFNYDTSDYLKRKRLKSGEDSISRQYCYAANSCVQQILPYLGDKFLKSITTGMIESLLMQLKEEKNYASGYLNNLLSSLKIIFKEAYRLGLIDDDPASKVERFRLINKQKKGILTLDEYKIIFDKSKSIWKKEEYYWINLLAFSTGMRVGEILGLQRTDIPSDGNLITIKNNLNNFFGLGKTKNKTDRIIYVTDYLMDYLRSRPDGFIFTVNYQNINANLKSVLRKLNVKDRYISFHCHRRAFITYSRQRGIPDNLIRDFVGHKSQQMTEHYTTASLITQNNATPFRELQELIQQN